MNPGFVEAGGKEAARHPLMAADDALKRSTDCIYFLASPLTCKKGKECEYRHSEGARANPIDCRYWLNGNCLKPKCLFRHPKLDGLVGIPATTFATAPHPNVPSKQSVPCIYFQKGRCLKGDKCPFMHWPQWTGAEIIQKPKESSSNGLETLRDTIDKQLETKGAAEKLPEIHHPLENGPCPPRAWPGQLFQNGRDADKLSPGFDVIVDDGSGYRREVAHHRGSHQYPATDYEQVGNGVHGCYGVEQICYGPDQRRCVPKRRALHREDDGPEESDLRHRLLLKRRRSNGSSEDGHRADEERGKPMSSRLQGRITLLPVAARSSQLPGRERGSIRHRITFPPVRPRNQDFSARRTRKKHDEMGGPSNFAAPKSLAELKGSKVSQKSIGVGKTLVGSQESSGPMPLTDILKKREAEEDKASSSSEAGSSGGLEFICLVEAVGGGIQEPKVAPILPVEVEAEDVDTMMVDEGYNAPEVHNVEAEGEVVNDDQEVDDEEDDFVKKVKMLYG